MRRFLAPLAFVVLVQSPWAAGASPGVRAEIDALLSRLLVSNCEFYRNGTWHSAAEARAHLLRKLEYLEDRNAVRSTEQFIEQGASASSLSGKPYRVKCGATAPVDSRTRLSNELRTLRAAK